MTSLAPGELPGLLLAVALLLATARLCGTAAKWIGQPSVLGEPVAGVVLGPTLFGRFAPATFAWLYPESGAQASAFSVLTLVSIILFLAVAGNGDGLNRAGANRVNGLEGRASVI